MTNQTTITKGSKVIILNESSEEFGTEGVVERVFRRTFKGDAIPTRMANVRIAEKVLGDDFSIEVRISDLGLAIANEYIRGQIARRQTELREERAAKRNAWMMERRAAKLKQYAAKRVEDDAVAVLPLLNVREMDNGFGSGRIEYDAFNAIGEGNQFREVVTIYTGSSSRDLDESNPLPGKIEVNWSAIGSVSPTVAMRFAKVLLAAATRACNLEAAQETLEMVRAIEEAHKEAHLKKIQA